MESLDFNQLKPFLPNNLVVQIMNIYFKEMFQCIEFLQDSDEMFLK